jgi:hypothetical protein
MSGEGQDDRGRGRRCPVTVTTAAERRSRGPPARTGSPSRPTAAAATPAAKITRSIGRSGRNW